ncbi:protein LURP-one-related 11-like [Magnolia sinica]|uniref:protein LURP-one-related 11-like n=1 Tax=Magnolia sinica TaxID=86752 RepID=UPI00265B1A2C|nr:protein LURP-one-related 11-like [Magnolia sinica]
MAKIHPLSILPSSCSSSSSDYMTLESEVFTIWMKSLVFNGNGCTVYDSNGQIVYRIDNYNHKCGNEVYLMDLRGKVLLTIRRKKHRIFGCWEGYKCNGSNEEKPWFKVRKPWRILKGDSPCEVSLGWDKDQPISYRIEGLDGRSACKIVDQNGGLVAEVKQKHSTSGVVLGDDVLSLVVEPNIDHSLIMGLMVVHGLINQCM